MDNYLRYYVGSQKGKIRQFFGAGYDELNRYAKAGIRLFQAMPD